MAGAITVNNTFASQAGPIPLSQLDSNFTQSNTGLNSLINFNNYYTDTSGSANSIVISVASPQVVAYVAGLMLSVKVANTNTGATTINVNSLGTQAVTTNVSTALTAGLITANQVVTMVYDGTQFQLLSRGGSGTVTSVAMTVPTFLSVSGSPVTSSGTLAVSLSGTALPVLNGGTGVTTSTGTGSVVLSTSPTFTTPILGTPTSGTLSNCTVDGTNKVGYLGLPQSANTTLATSDRGKSILATGTITIPNSTFAAGDAVTIVNNSASSITITTNLTTTHLAGTATTGTTRTLAQWGTATIYFVSATVGIISGSGLT